ncbi:hypothetical protein Knedl_CDS0011 [Pseudomonas phage Knedl]|nr:hypothetical protein Knedl_CDS0011 [Pseudomonas phage Knedl]
MPQVRGDQRRCQQAPLARTPGVQVVRSLRNKTQRMMH